MISQRFLQAFCLEADHILCLLPTYPPATLEQPGPVHDGKMEGKLVQRQRKL